MSRAVICVLAGMIDAKLAAKIAPLQANPDISEIHLIRRHGWYGEKITCHAPPKWALRFLAIAEVWRLTSLALVCLTKRPSALVAFGTIPHGIYCWIIGRVLHIPVIQHVMGKNDLRLTFPRQRGRKLTLSAVRGASLVAVRGARMADWLISQGIQRERIFIPQNVHDFALFQPGNPEQADHDFVYLGLLAPYKRIDLMLEAMARVCRKHPSARLMVVGDGSEKERLQHLAATLSLTDNVTFVGAVAHTDISKWLIRGKIFVMSSAGEGLPQAMIEAMSCGLPTVVPSDADIEEVARDGQNALLVRKQDANAYAQSLLHLLEDEELFARLRSGALAIRKEHAEQYSLEHQCRLWQEQLCRIVAMN